MLTKFPLSKLTVVGGSMLALAAVWTAVASTGSPGAALPEPAPAAYIDTTPADAAPHPPVVIERTIVVRRLHESGAGDALAAPPPAPANAPPPPPAPVAAAPPQPPGQPRQQAPTPTPVTRTRGS